MAVQLLDLPQPCLEEIFKRLSYSEISQLGAVCRYFREISKTIFRLYFRRQEDKIEKEMEKVEKEAARSEKLTVDEHLYLALLHSVLRILLSEAKMLKAHCWRYIRDPSYDFCFPAGKILDEFENILRSIREKTLNKDMEPEISTTLFHLGEKFYDYFDSKIESYFRESSDMQANSVLAINKETLLPALYSLASNATRENLCRGRNDNTFFGVKLIDILDCCSTSDFHSLVYYDHQRKAFQIKAEYKLTDVNILQALPTISLSSCSTQSQLNKVCRYIRNNVRWTNLFHPLQDLWILEDATELNRNLNTASALLRQWKHQRSAYRVTFDELSSDTPQYNYKRTVCRYKNCFGLIISTSMECPTMKNMPLQLQHFLDTYKAKQTDNIKLDGLSNKTHDSVVIKCISNHFTENITYKFHLELKIQYPSFLTEKIQEAILKVDQLNEETTITSNRDEVQKSAAFIADDENYND